MYARLYLDYASVVYSLHCLYSIDIVESMQHYFTKKLHNLCTLNYFYRKQLLVVAALKSLELHRLQTDLTFVFKILHGDIDSSLRKNFVHNITGTRGNCFILYKNSFRLDVCKYFFTCKVFDVWINYGKTLIM